jgi:hypothetical protein
VSKLRHSPRKTSITQALFKWIMTADFNFLITFNPKVAIISIATVLSISARHHPAYSIQATFSFENGWLDLNSAWGRKWYPIEPLDSLWIMTKIRTKSKERKICEWTGKRRMEKISHGLPSRDHVVTVGTCQDLGSSPRHIQAAHTPQVGGAH